MHVWCTEHTADSSSWKSNSLCLSCVNKTGSSFFFPGKNCEYECLLTSSFKFIIVNSNQLYSRSNMMRWIAGSHFQEQGWQIEHASIWRQNYEPNPYVIRLFDQPSNGLVGRKASDTNPWPPQVRSRLACQTVVGFIRKPAQTVGFIIYSPRTWTVDKC